MHSALFPSEFDAKLLRFGSKKSFGNGQDDWNMPVLYDGLPLQIQTPIMRNVFGLSKYENNSGRVSYSLSWCLEPQGDVNEFREFIEYLDKLFTDELIKEGLFKFPYYSSIRPSRKAEYSDTLRVKLKTRYDEFDCAFKDGRASRHWKVDDTDRVRANDLARLSLELMPVWCAGGKIGTSWKAVAIQKHINPEDFRGSEGQPQHHHSGDARDLTFTEFVKTLPEAAQETIYGCLKEHQTKSDLTDESRAPTPPLPHFAPRMERELTSTAPNEEAPPPRAWQFGSKVLLRSGRQKVEEKETPA